MLCFLPMMLSVWHHHRKAYSTRINNCDVTEMRISTWFCSGKDPILPPGEEGSLSGGV